MNSKKLNTKQNLPHKIFGISDNLITSLFFFRMCWEADKDIDNIEIDNDDYSDQQNRSNACVTENQFPCPPMRIGSMTNNRFINNIHVVGDDTIQNHWKSASYELIENGTFNSEKYEAFKANALEERAQLGAGKSMKMNKLYCFWCFFLREQFNQDMYDDFLSCAREDVLLGSHYGIECYFRFCSYGLETNWIPEVYDDFEMEAMADYRRGFNYGLEKFKAFHINQKHDFEIPIKPETQRELDKYPTCRSFRENPQNGQKVQTIFRKPRRTVSDAYRPPNFIPFAKRQQVPSPHVEQKEEPKENGNKKNKKRKQKQNNKFVYYPENDKSARDLELEKEKQEAEKQKEKQERETIKSLPSNVYKPPMFDEIKLPANHAPLPNNKQQQRRPQKNQYENRNNAPKGWTFGKAQPQSLPKGSPFQANRW